MISQKAARKINSGDLLTSPRTTPPAPLSPAANNPHREELGGDGEEFDSENSRAEALNACSLALCHCND